MIRFLMSVFFCILFSGSAVLADEIETVQAQPAKTKSEPFKGKAPTENWGFSGLTGAGVYGSKGGVTLTAGLSKKILDRGFLSDINNQVHVEVQMGPLWVFSSHAWYYSTHLRWDFIQDSQWRFYALAGVSGHVTSQALLDRWTFIPRTGIGAFFKLIPGIFLRGELSHEMTAIGVHWAI
ncbi:MAG: hypothetical protein JNL01_07150 [Bdellovibrionales bacterium]|nr:hypothetical protein [Bdellovibrionales bacterium]